MMVLEFHQLELRYASMRSAAPKKEKRLLSSLIEHGQQTPVVVINANEANRYVLIDGYKRVRALNKMASDTVQATRWDLGEADALMFERLLRMDQDDSAIEQGRFLLALVDGFGLSPKQLAKRLDKSDSWVSRRLGLVKVLPEAAIELVRTGQVCAHAAEKFLVPLARAKSGDCVVFAQSVAQARYSVRQVGDLYRGLTSGSEKTRALVLENPALFLEAQKAVTAEKKPKAVVEQVLEDLSILASICRRVERRLLEPTCVLGGVSEEARVLDAFAVAKAAFQILDRQLSKGGKDARPGHTHSDLKTS